MVFLVAVCQQRQLRMTEHFRLLLFIKSKIHPEILDYTKRYWPERMILSEAIEGGSGLLENV
jgi:hypothetical protein